DEEDVTTAVYMGNVRGTYKNIEFRSEIAVIWVREAAESYELYARGDIRIKNTTGDPISGSGNVLNDLNDMEQLRAEKMYINPGGETNRTTRAELRMRAGNQDEVVVLRGKEFYMLDAENFAIEQVQATHCPFGDPHYHINAKRARIIREDPHLFVSMWNPGIETGPEERTLIRTPFLSEDFGDETGFLLRSVRVGNSGRYGTFLQTRWRPAHLGLRANWIDNLGLRLDYFSRRGFGAGSELQYSFDGPLDSTNRGFIRGYYVHDNAKTDNTGLAVPKRNRGRLWWQHRLRWNEHWRTDAELHWLSDHGFLQEFYEEEFKNQRPPESYLFTRYLKNQTWGGITVKTQVNDFLNQVEEMPSLRLEQIGIPADPFVYDASYDAGIYNLQTSDQLTMTDPSELSRLHSEQRLSLPFSIDNLQIDPYIRALATWVSDTDSGQDSGSKTQLGGGGGARISMDLHRNYATESDTWDINRFRHIMTPYLEAQGLWTSSDSEDFVQLGGLDPWPRDGHGPRSYTDNIDGIDDLRRTRVGLRQRLQTKRRSGDEGPWKNVNWVDLDVALVNRSEDSTRIAKDDDYVELDFTWNIFDWLDFKAKNNRFSLDDGTDVYNASTTIKFSPTTQLGAGYNYISGKSNSIRANFKTNLSDRYALQLSEIYELDSKGKSDSINLLSKVVLKRYFHKWVASLSLTHDGRNDGESEIMIMFHPRGLASAIPSFAE
ncbi:MAG: LPS assembly protein LptD, partial [Planctomycetota bacterium]